MYTPSVSNNTYKRVATWVINVTGVIPGLLAVFFALYIRVVENDSPFVWTLLSAGLLLETGAVQLSLLLRKQANIPDNVLESKKTRSVDS